MIEVSYNPHTFAKVDRALKKMETDLAQGKFIRSILRQGKDHLLRLLKQMFSLGVKIHRGWGWEERGKDSYFLYNKMNRLNPRGKIAALNYGIPRPYLIRARRSKFLDISEWAAEHPGAPSFVKQVRAPARSGAHFFEKTIKFLEEKSEGAAKAWIDDLWE